MTDISREAVEALAIACGAISKNMHGWTSIGDDSANRAIRADADVLEDAKAAILALRAEVDALEAKLAERVTVKPLKWRQVKGETAFVAQTTIGDYKVRWSARYHVWVYDGRAFEHVDQAKAAAQADYERRVLAAVTTTPITPAGRVC